MPHPLRHRTAAVLLAAAPLAPLLLPPAPAAAAPESLEVACTSMDVELAYRLGRDILEAVDAAGSTTAVYVHDRTTGTTCEVNADRRYDSASVVKVTVLGALLLDAQKRGRELTSREKSHAHAMITASSNASTSALWQQLGRARIERFLKAAGMTDTVPGAGGYWGLTQITARDQGRLLDLLTAKNDLLSDDSRAYALKLMGQVIPAQRWGTPAGATATAHLKNGWLPRAAHGWRVHSIGAFAGDGRDYTISVLTQDNAAMSEGVKTIEAVSRAVHRHL
ncbi:serine hydrolase [Streptomyces jumonjinensis]|uniref:Serine hydrolase n=2 Tax=Streptomyces TaxID=1883 RepID=A0A646KH41_STRJU|nr:serine hydrolase [Streptomyces jumonjinensis]MQT01544.1 serine hydrolase [Streptomyces jumonjinensis]